MYNWLEIWPVNVWLRLVDEQGHVIENTRVIYWEYPLFLGTCMSIIYLPRHHFWSKLHLLLFLFSESSDSQFVVLVGVTGGCLHHVEIFVSPVNLITVNSHCICMLLLISYHIFIYLFIVTVDKLTKGKANTAHCLRFPGDWYGLWYSFSHLFLLSTDSSDILHMLFLSY